MARGPQVALSSGHRMEGRISWGAELCCLPRGLEAEGSPPQLATWRTWRGSLVPARPGLQRLIAQGRGENSAGGWGVSPAMSVGRGSPAVLLPPPPSASTALRGHRAGPGAQGSPPSQVRQHRLSRPPSSPRQSLGGGVWARPRAPCGTAALCSVLSSELVVPALLSPPTGSFPKDHDQEEKGGQG